MRYSSPFFIFVYFLFFGCSSHQEIKASNEYQPDFVEFLPREKGVLFGVAHESNPDAVIAQQNADYNAQLELVFLFAMKAQKATLATFLKAELSRELYDSFLSKMQDALLLLEYPETRIDRREYVNEVMYSLARCSYTLGVLQRIQSTIISLIKNDEALYQTLVQKQFWDDLIERLDHIEEY
ncbi:MAG: hypothetical protein OCC49_08460 [Fibrobacterales bacterium]